ncbi:MAG TPA: hypothetical protein PKU80_01910 [Candidatus Limiplasma sp.]|nr:hypothetical protein [Candidatus Limiplasma sp.]HRX07838.1 hypothetical protein [Candidatus Limiplasma sp.]
MKKYFASGNAYRDFGMLLFCVSLIGAILMIVLAPVHSQMLYLALLGTAFVGVVLGMFGKTTAAIIWGGAQVILWTAYKLYLLVADGSMISFPLDYLWVPAPMVLISGICLYQYGSSRLETENRLLRAQVEELVMVDSVTGLNNLRALYRDMPGMINLCERHGRPLSLMLIKLRYHQELRSFLSSRQFTLLRQRLSELVQKQMRLEDRLYAMDENGTLGVLLIADNDGCEIVKKRIKAMANEAAAFESIAKDNLVVSLSIANRLCRKDSGTPIEIKLRVESELVYDV